MLHDVPVRAGGPGSGSTTEVDAAAHTARIVDASDQARADEYLLLASLLRAAPTAGLLAGLAALKGSATPLGMAHLTLATVAERTDAAAAGHEHFRLFIGVGRGELVPYASYYLTGFLHERPLARVREDMARLGIERQPGVFEPEDSASALLEVMAGLVCGAFDAPAGSADAVFKRHIAPWCPRLMADLSVVSGTPFYNAVGHVGRVFLEIETEALRLPE